MGQARGAGRVGTRGSTGDSSSSTQYPGRGRGNPLVLTGEALALPTSCPRPRAMPVGCRLLPPIRQAPPAQEWLHPGRLRRQEGLGILSLTLPTSGKSDRRRRDEWGGGGQGSREEKSKVEMRPGSWRACGPRLGLCYAEAGW